jgi:hypothetical protein
VFTLFAFIFPTFGAAVVRTAARQPRRSGGLFSRPVASPREPVWDWKRLPHAARVGLPVLIVVLWFQGLIAITSLPGQPEKHDGHYYANSHGDLIPRTAAQYHHDVAVQQRIFATGATTFYLAAAVIVWMLPPRRRTAATAE